MKYNHLQQDSRLAILVRSLGGKCTEWHRGSRSPIMVPPEWSPFWFLSLWIGYSLDLLKYSTAVKIPQYDVSSVVH